MAIDKTMIINWALTELGPGAMFSTDDESDLALQIENTWQRTVDHVFSLHDWSWTRRTRKLAALADTPDNGWSKGFALPADRIGAPKQVLFQAGANPLVCRHYAIEGAHIFANAADLWATFRVLIEPDDWDVAFRAAFVKALAGNLAVPVYQDKGLGEDLRVEAFGVPSKEGTGGMFGRLMAQDLAAEPMGQPPLADDPLTQARLTTADPYTSWAGRYA